MPSSRPLFVHVGLPKTGTTFVQRVLGEGRAELRSQGLLYPGSRNDHFLEAQDVLERPFQGHVDEQVAGSWQALVGEVDDWPGAALISHEVFTVARADQVRTVLGAFPDRQPEIIVTARDLARQLTANWQETVKNGQSQTLAEYVDDARSGYTGEDRSAGFWFWQDLVAVLETWSDVVSGDHVHLITVPPRGAGPALLWERFSGVLGVELGGEALPSRSANVSLGRAETEFLRRLNTDLTDSVDWADYRTYVKQFLAGRALPRFEQSGPIVLSAADQTWAATVSQQIVDTVAKLPLRLHGDLDDLVSASTSAEAAPVTDEEVAEVGVRAIAQMLRRIGREQAETVQTGTAS